MKLLSSLGKKTNSNNKTNTKLGYESEVDSKHLVSEQKGIQMFHKSMQIDSVDVYLDEPIVDLPYYRNLIQYLREMTEHDTLRLWIDTPGGDLNSALAIIDAINNTQGEVLAIVTGEAASAGSLIALLSPNLILGDRARFFLHAASYGIGFSKQNDIESYVDNNKTFLREIMKEAYTGFLTPEEMELLFVGKDYYFRGDELRDRIQRRVEFLESTQDTAPSCSLSLHGEGKEEDTDGGCSGRCFGATGCTDCVDCNDQFAVNACSSEIQRQAVACHSSEPETKQESNTKVSRKRKK